MGCVCCVMDAVHIHVLRRGIVLQHTGVSQTRKQIDTSVKSILIVFDDPDIGPFLMESIKLETP